MAEKIFIAQRDFSSGEVDPNAKRRDDVDRVKAGARQMRNFRPRQTGAIDVRPGRRAIAPAIGKRTELLRVSSAPDLYIEFSAGKVDIYDLTGTLVATNTSASYLWTNSTLATIVWCVAENEIIMCYPGMQPQMAIWGGSTFTFQAYTFTVGFGVTQMPFFRFSVPGATMTYSSPATGAGVGLICSQPYFTNAMIGATLSIIGQQCTVTAVTDSTHATVTVASRLPAGVTVTVAAVTPFVVGQVAAFATQTFKMEIQSINSGALTVSGVLLSAVSLTGSLSADTLVGPSGSSAASSVVAAATATTEQWQEQFMGALRGWPASCFFDNNRLGFCDFTQRPEAILWSATGGDYQNCWVDSLATALQPDAGSKPNSAMLEFISAKPRVKFVVGWGDEFAFTDLGVYQIPISVNNPLKPGSVQFIPVGDGGCAHIHPMLARDAVLFVNAGLTRVSALLRTGSLTTPYILQDVTEFHGHLISNPITLTISAGDGAYPERYAYIVNADGSVVVGKFTQDKQFVGWVPWSGPGTVQWMSAIGTRVLSNVLYGSIGLVELEDNTLYLDGAIPVNAVPTAMVKAGKGPCWPSANGTVTLMDGLLDMGERAIDANGNIELISGDDLSSPTLMAGQIFQQTLEPFTPQAQGGPDVKQRQRRRRIARAMVTVQNGTAFTWGDRDIPAFLFNEPTDVAPPLRETTYSARTRGRDYDPRIILQKVRPGPLTVLEVGIEVTI